MDAEEFWGQEEAKWQGYRRLSDEQVHDLAEAIVEEVKTRGPFLSLSHFVNREVGSPSERTLQGAVQAAIDAAEINLPVFDHTSEDIDPTGYDMEFPEAARGKTGTGAPAFLNQADVLSPIANVLSVRSDTFRIRAYGDVADRDGKTKSRAWCEAIVQRVPNFVNDADAAHEVPNDPDNVRFGRRFKIVHFRWLSPDEL